MSESGPGTRSMTPEPALHTAKTGGRPRPIRRSAPADCLRCDLTLRYEPSLRLTHSEQPLISGRSGSPRSSTGASETTGHAAAAPRGALLYPRLSREELEGRFLGLMAYLDGKPEGDNSMPGK